MFFTGFKDAVINHLPNLREFKTTINVKNISPKTFLFKKIFVT